MQQIFQTYAEYGLCNTSNDVVILVMTLQYCGQILPNNLKTSGGSNF